jgi:hypothetical protein
MIRRFLLGLGLAIALQATAFAIYYDDLIFLRRSVPQIVAGSRETFVRHAEAALVREHITVRHAETIAQAAREFGVTSLEVAALERRVRMSPSDQDVRFRFADALRRNGQFAEAEATYLALLASTSGESRP